MSILKGFEDRRNEIRREKAEIAKLFEEFRRNNPDATYDDYQDFIDGMVGYGGANYLRGGLPSDSMLRNMAEENKRKANVREAQERIDNLTRMNQAKDQISSLAKNFLASTESLDLDRDAFAKSLGYDDAQSITPDIMEEQFGMPDIFTDFTEMGRNQIFTQRTKDALPAIQDLIRSSDGKITPDQVRSQLPSLIHVSDEILQGQINRENSARARDTATFMQGNRDKLMRVIEQNIEKGNDEIEAAINLTFGPDLKTLLGYDEVPKELYEPAIEEARRNREIQEEEFEAAASTKMADIEQRLLRDEDLARYMISDKDKALQTIANTINSQTTRRDRARKFENLGEDGMVTPRDVEELYQRIYDSGVIKLEDAYRQNRANISGLLSASDQQVLAQNQDEMKKFLTSSFGGNDGIGQILSTNPDISRFDVNSYAFKKAVQEARDEFYANFPDFQRGQGDDQALDEQQLGALQQLVLSKLQGGGIRTVQDAQTRARESIEDANAVYRVEDPTQTIQTQIADNDLTVQFATNRLDAIQSAFAAGTLTEDQYMSRLRDYIEKTSGAIDQVSQRAEQQYNAGGWATQRIPDNFVDQITNDLSNRLNPSIQQAQLILQEAERDIARREEERMQGVQGMRRRTAPGASYQATERDRRIIAQNVDDTMDNITSALDAMSQGRSYRLQSLQEAQRGSQTFFSSKYGLGSVGQEDRIVRGGDELTVQQVENQRDKFQSIVSGNLRKNVQIRLANGSEAVSDGIMEDLMNPNVTMDQVIQKYRLYDTPEEMRQFQSNNPRFNYK